MTNETYPYLEELIFPETEPFLLPQDWDTQMTQLRELGQKIGCEVINLLPLQKGLAAEKAIVDWLARNQPKIIFLEKIRQLTSILAQNVGSADERARERYRVEYSIAPELEELLVNAGIAIDEDEVASGLSQSPTNYSFWTPSLLPEIFCLIGGLELSQLQSMNILNVGAGTGEFEKALMQMGASPRMIQSVDISATSQKRLEEIGIQAYQSRLEEISPVLPTNFDLVSLQYFVDRDSAQAITFETALKLLDSKGKIILEGLLPAELFDSNGITYTDSTENLVTVGKSVVEDLELIIKSFMQSANRQGVNITIERIVAGIRYVYSQDGFELLPTYFLTLSKE